MDPPIDLGHPLTCYHVKYLLKHVSMFCQWAHDVSLLMLPYNFTVKTEVLKCCWDTASFHKDIKIDETVLIAYMIRRNCSGMTASAV